EDFFEEFGWGLLFLFALFAGAFDFEEVFDAGDGVAEDAVGVVEGGAALKRVGLLFGGCVDEIVGVELPAELEEFLFEAGHFDPELAGQAEDGEMVGGLALGWRGHGRTSRGTKAFILSSGFSGFRLRFALGGYTPVVF